MLLLIAIKQFNIFPENDAELIGNVVAKQDSLTIKTRERFITVTKRKVKVMTD